jgi:hypothetical protein
LGLGQRAAYSLLDVVVINWRPGEAYLVGKKKGGKKMGPAPTVGEDPGVIKTHQMDFLSELEKEIAAGRETE